MSEGEGQREGRVGEGESQRKGQTGEGEAQGEGWSRSTKYVKERPSGSCV